MPDLLDALTGSTRTRSDAEGRVYELVIGVVKDVADPQGLYRVRARIAGQKDDDTTNWLMPCLPGGILARPNVDDLVVVGFLQGNPAMGVYLASISSTQRGLPSESMLLATTFVGMYNHLVDLVNELRSDMSGHVHAAGTLQCPNTGTGIAVAVTGSTFAGPTIVTAAAAKGKAADGSVPASISDSRKVLSATQKVR